MSKILMVASEAIPFAKTGGLADVIGSLSPILRASGEEVAVFLPRYRSINHHSMTRVYDDLHVWFGSASYAASIYSAVENGVPFYFLDCPPLFDREGLYGDAAGDYPDNHVRFAVFARAALPLVRHLFRPDIIHCHDWQSALVPVYIHTLFASDPTFFGLKTVLTIHNLGYQGIFRRSLLPEIGLEPPVLPPGLLDFHDQINLLKGGILMSDAVTTVSRKYAREIRTPELGFGLDDVLRSRGDALVGIPNGANYADWDPRTDPLIPANYSAENLAGKRECKAQLLAELGLPPGSVFCPLVGIVSRFARPKVALIEEAAATLLEEDGVCLAALGVGDPHYEQFFLELAKAYPKQVAVRIAYDNPLAHKIEAAADIFLMPSQYEPCGLNQIFSLRYGAVPVVHATGGLDDTIDEETGFKFREYSGLALVAAVRAALKLYRDPQRWRAMMLAGMRKDFSWEVSAREYSDLYRRLAG
jgi:starch synthase